MVIVQVGDLDKKQLDCLIYSLRSIELLLAFSSKLLFICWYFVAYQVEMYNWPVSGALIGVEKKFGFPLHLLTPILPSPKIKLLN